MSEKPGLAEAAAEVRRHFRSAPQVGVVLGSGLGAAMPALGDGVTLPYASVPGMPEVGVAGHAGKLVLGYLGKVPIACLEGRAHAYEGHPMHRVVYGVRLLAELGCRAVLLTNAAGGIREGLRAGDLMLISDHLNLTGQNPLVGSQGGPASRFTDMTDAYDAEVRALARAAAEDLNLDLKEGVYAGVLGPSYETPAEIRMLRTLGADAVGMSTVAEVVALRHLGVRVGAISAITNLAAGLSAEPLDHADVRRAAERVRSALGEILARWVTLLSGALARA
jgi:purine-nucleoside phosphorylase